MTPSRLDELEKFYAAFFSGDDKHVVMYSRDMCYLFRVALAAVAFRNSYCEVEPGRWAQDKTWGPAMEAFDAALEDRK